MPAACSHIFTKLRAAYRSILLDGLIALGVGDDHIAAAYPAARRSRVRTSSKSRLPACVDSSSKNSVLDSLEAQSRAPTPCPVRAACGCSPRSPYAAGMDECDRKQLESIPHGIEVEVRVAAMRRAHDLGDAGLVRAACSMRTLSPRLARPVVDAGKDMAMQVEHVDYPLRALVAPQRPCASLSARGTAMLTGCHAVGRRVRTHADRGQPEPAPAAEVPFSRLPLLVVDTRSSTRNAATSQKFMTAPTTYARPPSPAGRTLAAQPGAS